MNKNEIPNGHYCYEVEKTEEDGTIRLKLCPHYEMAEKDSQKGYCNLINTEICNFDKECGINE